MKVLLKRSLFLTGQGALFSPPSSSPLFSLSFTPSHNGCHLQLSHITFLSPPPHPPHPPPPLQPSSPPLGSPASSHRSVRPQTDLIKPHRHNQTAREESKHTPKAEFKLSSSRFCQRIHMFTHVKVLTGYQSVKVLC